MKNFLESQEGKRLHPKDICLVAVTLFLLGCGFFGCLTEGLKDIIHSEGFTLILGVLLLCESMGFLVIVLGFIFFVSQRTPFIYCIDKTTEANKESETKGDSQKRVHSGWLSYSGGVAKRVLRWWKYISLH